MVRMVLLWFSLVFAHFQVHFSTPLDFLFQKSGVTEVKNFLATAPPASLRPEYHIPSAKSLNRLDVRASSYKRLVSAPPVYDGSPCPGPYAASLKSCQVYSEEACFNPFLSEAAALAIQQARDDGLGSSVSHFTYGYCYHNHCANSECDDPLQDGEEERCTKCMRACHTYCLLNHEKLCLQAVCGKSLSLAASLMVDTIRDARKATNPDQSKRKEIRDLANIAKDSGMSLTALGEVELQQVGAWYRSLVTPMNVTLDIGLCSDDAIMSSDTTVIASGGISHTSALVSCINNHFTLNKIAYTAANFSRVSTTNVCSMVDQCPRNNTAVALDRATEGWNVIVKQYQSRMLKNS